jgi:nucleotide-binding universal stress UspA family protein
MTNRILIPLDGSPIAESVIPQALRFWAPDAELILLNVIVPVPVDAYLSSIEVGRAAAKEYIEGIRERVELHGVKATALVREGMPADVILEAARDEHATHIAMATHGRGGIARFLMGSVAEAVMRASPVPVFALRPFWNYEVLAAARVEDLPVKNVLVPLDGSSLSLAVIPHAVEVARKFGARLLLMRAVPPGAAVAHARAGADQEEVAEKFSDLDQARRALEEIGAEVKALGVDVGTVVDQDEPARAILDTVRFHAIDLVAMTTHGRTGITRMVVGSVTESVLRDAQIPLLVVRGIGKRTQRRHALAKKERP